jgi:4-deoxy-L-threo-5-hexosulose-uronate ketol-isomerase
MDVRHPADPIRFERMTTAEIRQNFLVESLFRPDEIALTYSHADRAVVGSAVPATKSLALEAPPELRAAAFCDRRELGILNVGGPGTVMVDGVTFPLAGRDGLYVGRGSKDVRFMSDAARNPARFYLLSFPAHAAHPTVLVRQAEAEAVRLGTVDAANRRTLYKFIHPGGVRSCQLVMGFTALEPGSVWNSVPPHTHDRRMEVYLYFDLDAEARVFHFMGRPDATRHLVVANGQAVISPSWSIHCGAGTGSYAFCWGMGGENQAFDDMDALTLADLQ